MITNSNIRVVCFQNLEKRGVRLDPGSGTAEVAPSSFRCGALGRKFGFGFARFCTAIPHQEKGSWRGLAARNESSVLAYDDLDDPGGHGSGRDPSAGPAHPNAAQLGSPTEDHGGAVLRPVPRSGVKFPRWSQRFAVLPPEDRADAIRILPTPPQANPQPWSCSNIAEKPNGFA